MPHPLEQKLAALRRRLRRIEAVHALSLAMATLLAALVSFGAVDYLFQLHDRGLRIIASLSAIAVIGWIAYRVIVSPLFAPLRDVDLALRTERFFPNLRNRLASAIEFLHQSEDDPAAGSPALRRAVIAQATAETQAIDFSTVLNPRPAIHAAAVLLAACLIVIAVVALAPSVSKTALLRLLNPFGSATWPQVTHLVVRPPIERIARGQNVRIEAVDANGARLPQDVRIHYRLQTPDGGTVEETEPMRCVEQAMVADRENVVRPFSFRIEGGDDRSMPWTDVEVVDPPAIESVSIRLTPPAYTGQPPVASERHIRAIAGTRVEIATTATKPLRSAELCFENGRRLPAVLTADGQGFSVGDVIEKSGAYWIELTDTDGLKGGGNDRWQFVAVPDVPPTVRIENPADNLYVTPQAVVPLRIAAKDDLALRSITLLFRLADAARDESIELFGAPPQPPRQSAVAPAGDSRIVDYRWDLASLRLQPGTQIAFRVAATDYRPQNAASDPRRLLVVTPDELQDRIAEREGLIVAELDRALKMQRACREQVEKLRSQLADLTWLERPHVDGLQAVEHSQRDIDQVLTSRSHGVAMYALALLADIENNRLDNADSRRRMTSLLDELDRLDRDEIPPLARELTAAVKTAQIDREGQGGDRPNFRLSENGTVPLRGTSAIRSVAESLAAAEKHQDAIAAAIERQIAQLARWNGYRRLHREIGQLIRDQEDAARRTAEVGRRTLARDLRDLAAQDAADLQAAVAGQLELARLLDRVLQEADAAVVELQKTDALAADTVADALDQARRLAIAGQMRTAAGQIGQNQIGQAAAAQKQILQDLREILDLLANQRRNELVGLVKKLKQAQADLQAVERRQEELCRQFDAAAKDKDKDARARQLQQLAADQRRLREDVERLSRQLARLQADKPADAAALAGRQMNDADQRAGQGDAAAAGRSAADARLSLANARRRLADQLRDAAARLASEQVDQLEEQVKHLRGQQAGALDESRRLNDLERSQGRLTRSQALSLRDLARLQRSLQTDAAALAQRFAGAAAFELALTTAAADMRRAADQLDRRETGSTTQDAQQQAIGRLDLLVDVLKPEPPSTENQSPPGGDNPPQQGPQAATLPPLAELKLLKLMQQQINARSEALQKAAAGKPTPEQSREYSELAEQQGRLADIVQRSVQPAEQPNPPDKTPQIKPTYLRSVDEEQLKRELGAAAEKEDDNPMLAIARQMRETQQRIAKADSGPGTQQLQRQIVDDLDRLIQQVRRSKGQCRSGTSQSQPSSRSQTPGPQRNAAGPPNGQQETKHPATTKSPQAVGPKTTRKPDLAGTQAIIKRLWGVLPEREREQMLQSPPEEFPPEYELLIEDYFRRLSEEKGSR
jgi:hypothetical protein